ncbi:hypothetical protein FDECE_7465 [Fusarium decemcellulare]|nr:hypothetical protein FDECE_7465 [Fusarium decemcellulare]
MDTVAITRRAQDYGLHSCTHCQLFLIDLTNIVTLKSDAPLKQAIEVPGEKIFADAASNCSFFRYTKGLVLDTGKGWRMDGEKLYEEHAYKNKPERLVLQLEVECSYDYHRHGEDTRIMIGCRVLWKTPDSPVLLVSDPSHVYPTYNCMLTNDICEQLGGVPFWDRATRSRVDSEAVFSTSRKLLKECKESHPECWDSTQMSPPSRFIDVGLGQNPPRVRLISTTSRYGPFIWAALSYCWGGRQKEQTKRNNVQNRYKSIDVTKLPRTLVDAIHVCRGMEIPFLWVDSLCIIQDDKDDKTQEIRRMHDIYRGAIVTLLASVATSCTDGFLHNREPYSPGLALPVRYSSEYDIAQVAVKKYWVPEEPLDKRAWAFQERILKSSPRLWFAADFSLLRVQGTWRDLIINYSKRLLTRRQDKLVAIAAVAEVFAEQHGLGPHDYVAGLWKQTLVPDLQWHLIRPATREYKPAVESGPWVAPSWSWASVDCEVAWSDNVASGDFTPTARVDDVKVKSAEPLLPFGALKSAEVCLTGMLSQPVHLTKTFMKSEHSVDRGGHTRSLTPDWDRALDTAVYLLELETDIPSVKKREEEESEEEDDDDHYYITKRGLLLQLMEQQKIFRRVGFYEERGPFKDGVELVSQGCELCTRNSAASKTQVVII